MLEFIVVDAKDTYVTITGASPCAFHLISILNLNCQQGTIICYYNCDRF